MGPVVRRVLRAVREDKVLYYFIHRLKVGANLEDATWEEYVRQNPALGEIDEVVSGPELAVAACNQLERAFEFDEVRSESASR